MEKDFETRKNEYFDKLRENTDILNSVMNTNNKTKELLLFPRNERELLLAESIFLTISDMYLLLMNTDPDDIKIDVGSSLVIKLLVESIMALKNNDISEFEEINNRILKLNIKDTAKLMHELFVIFNFYVDEAIDTIANRCGFDLEDNVSSTRFKFLFEKAKDIVQSNKSNVNNQNWNTDDEEGINRFAEYAREFHALCVGGKLDKSDEMILKPNNK